VSSPSVTVSISSSYVDLGYRDELIPPECELIIDLPSLWDNLIGSRMCENAVSIAERHHSLGLITRD